MYLGIGFLAASLLALVSIPLVHARAVRLTMRRVQAGIPLIRILVRSHHAGAQGEAAVAQSVYRPKFPTSGARRIAKRRINEGRSGGTQAPFLFEPFFFPAPL